MLEEIKGEGPNSSAVNTSRPTTAAERRLTETANFFFSPKLAKEIKTSRDEPKQDRAKEAAQLQDGEDSDDPEDKVLMEEMMERQSLSQHNFLTMLYANDSFLKIKE